MQFVALAFATVFLSTQHSANSERIVRIIQQERMKHGSKSTLYVEEWESLKYEGKYGRRKCWFLKPRYEKCLDDSGTTYVSGPKGRFSKRKGGAWTKAAEPRHCWIKDFYPRFFGFDDVKPNRIGRRVSLDWNKKPRAVLELTWGFGEPALHSVHLFFDARTLMPLMYKLKRAYDPDLPDSTEAQATYPVFRWGVRLSPKDFGPAAGH